MKPVAIDPHSLAGSAALGTTLAALVVPIMGMRSWRRRRQAGDRIDRAEEMERPVEMMIGACEQALEDAPPNAKGKLERELARLRAVLARLQT